jgi:hypothetical protein
MQWFVVVIVILTAACGGKPSLDCATAIARGLDNVTEQLAVNAPDPALRAGMRAQSARLQGVLIERCTEDKWPSEVISCLASVRERTGVQVCVGQLSEDRRRALLTELRTSLMGQGARDLVAGARELLEQVGLTVALVRYAETARAESDRIAEEASKAKATFDAAITAAQQANEAVARLTRASEQLDQRLGAAVEAVMSARTDAQRAAANAKLEQLKKEAAEVRAQIAAAAAEAKAQGAAAQAAAAGSAAP